MSKKRPLTPLSVGPDDAARLMGISRARVYELKNAGELPFYKDGSRTLFPVAGIEARVERLSRIPKSGPPIGPLLPPADRKLARKKARAPDAASTEPLLPIEQQQRAVELASEPPPFIDLRQPAVEPESPAPASLDPRPAEPATASGWRAKV
jgi:excisionase family DNA binding protein